MTSSQSEALLPMVGAILDRHSRQNALVPLSAQERNTFAARLGILIAIRGLPKSLPPDKRGGPEEISAEEVAPLVARLLEGMARPAEWATPARQLIKACFQPVRAECRESYRAVTADGVCRRQQLERVRGRVSGTHCVDCPYWTAFAAGTHEVFLKKTWRGNPAEFDANRQVFLPEDFRALRIWLRAAVPGSG